MKRFLKKLSLFWTSTAPGIFLVGYNIGTGSITTMAAGGAGYNMSLLWALVLSCLFTYIMVVGFSKYTIVKSIETEGVGNDGISTSYKNKESIRHGDDIGNDQIVFALAIGYSNSQF